MRIDRRRRGAGAGLAAAACAFAPLLTLLGPTPSQAVEPPAPVQIVLDAVGPAAVKPTGKLVLRGAVVNPGPGVWHTPVVAVSMGHVPLATRGELHSLAVGAAPLRGAAAVPGGARTLADVAPGSSVTWKITLPMKSLKLTRQGVYALQVAARGIGTGPRRPPRR